MMEQELKLVKIMSVNEEFGLLRSIPSRTHVTPAPVDQSPAQVRFGKTSGSLARDLAGGLAGWFCPIQSGQMV